MRLGLVSAFMLVALMCTMQSCTKDDSNTEVVQIKDSKIVEYSYNSIELQTMELINVHRVSLGLNRLEIINHISHKSEEHDNYMIANNVVNHNDFMARSENIKKILGAKTVGENIAYNFNTPELVLKAWLASPGHKVNIEGNFTHFGLAIREDPVNKKKYFTNIFAKI
ncbi:uncharacterized protein YkwD [Flavobacterium sp. PL11]|jgi:uncharacterized protein YkwD|uniref:CAP domain-containing protein n=1 Tax=Flavobacterium sp. PL11 TaxID=3071717 RepID=UPI002DFE927E|nr:uncharacterized protein YkwD [Flavobacterium sp. PL11]